MTRSGGTGRRLRRGAVRAGLWAAALAAVLLAVLAGLALTETRLVLPAALVGRIEERIDDRLPDLSIDLGRVSVWIDDGAVPRLALEEVRLAGAGGTEIAALGEVGLAFDTRAALSGRIAPRALDVEGAHLTLRRDSRGRFELSFGGTGGVELAGPGDILQAAEAALARAPFDRVRSVTLDGALITVEDARTARVWQLTDGRVALDRSADGTELTIASRIFNGTDRMGRLRLALDSPARTPRATLRAELAGIAARDLALQSPALAALSVLDAPLSASLRAAVDDRGEVAGLLGSLRIGAGTLRPRAAVRPIPFRAASARIDYDPTRDRVEIPEVTVRSKDGSAQLSGHVDLVGEADGVPQELIGQLRIARLRLGAPELYPEPVEVTGGSVDLRLALDPFRLEVGRIELPGPGGDPERTVRVRGRVAAGAEGWDVSMDLAAERLDIARVQRFWPLPIAPGVRDFVTGRIADGEATDPALAIRWRTGMDKPELQMSLAFEGAKVRAVPFLPPVTGGAGFVELSDDRFTVAVDEGDVAPEGRPPVSLGGTTFVIPDTRVNPAPAEIELVSDGPLPSTLALLDAEPLRLLSRAGRTPDIAEGRLAATTRIGLRLQPGNTAEDIDVDSRGVVTGLVSETAVPGRRLTAERMEIEADKTRIRATGAAELSGVAFDGAWEQGLSGDAQGQGRVEGQVALSPEGLAAFGVALPDGFVSGSGTGRIEMDLGGGPPRFSVTSDLSGIGLSVAAVNWSKAPSRTGTFEVAGTLGEAPAIDRLRLDAPGLDASGRIELAPGPAFGALRLDRVVLGDWLDAGVTISARGPGQAPAIRVDGGSVDLRRAELGGDGGSGGGGAARGPVALRLDRLVLTDTIALRPVSVDLAAGTALRGTFRGQVNGGVAVDGQLAGGARGTSIRVTSRDAGAILRDAGLVRQVQGGALDLVLEPTGAKGTYDGRVRVNGIVLRDAPAIAELLSAISVVGLLEQLQTNGIPFDEVSAEFRVSPRAITLYRSSATGASLGLSMDGGYDMVTKRMDMQGVVSPIYLLNRVGSIFTRRGEGLFGVNFTLRGPVADPQVGVNPLSILTPGMFRDIFRRPPPERAAP